MGQLVGRLVDRSVGRSLADWLPDALKLVVMCVVYLKALIPFCQKLESFCHLYACGSV